ncbi:putative reverse transcriptase - house mosquito [Aphelenchoides avenae]|nr:putative reverse transcriptase - house mosquito [Aphelenchus avenae]
MVNTNHSTDQTCYDNVEDAFAKVNAMTKTKDGQSKLQKTFGANADEAPNTPRDFPVLQLNVNGLKNKAKELEALLTERDILVAVLQETKLGPKQKTPKFSNYTIVRKDRTTHGGGLAILVHHRLVFTERVLVEVPGDAHLEQMAVDVATKSGHLTIVNVYIPPDSSCEPGYKPSLAHLLEDGDTSDTLVLGDLNAHDPLWHSTRADARGSALSEEMLDSNYGVLNEDAPTRLPSAGEPTSPDVSLASSSLLTSAEWQTLVALGSDHLPILITLQSSVEGLFTPRTTYVNIGKADWPAFRSRSEQLFAQLVAPRRRLTIAAAEKIIRKVIQEASKHTIPAGRRKLIVPYLSAEVRSLTQQRDALRSAAPHSPRIVELNAQITDAIASEKRAQWQAHVESMDFRKDASRLWRTIKSLDGKPFNPPNGPVSFSGVQHARADRLADLFNKQYTRVRPHDRDPLMRRTVRKVKRTPLEDAPQFTTVDVAAAIRRAKNSKAAGPDGITMLHLKHLGPLGLERLTDVINVSLACCSIPAIWKRSTIIPLPKAGKDPSQSTSYRPVSLLCPAAKVLEALLLPSVTKHMPPATHQHGFRPLHSTTSALLEITSDVATGFNQKKPAERTVLVSLDLSKAFDTVDHRQLIDAIYRSTLPRATVRWLSAYLRGRQARTQFRGATSSVRIVRTGVPQGSVLSPALFNAYLSDLPAPPPGVKISSYADDIAIRCRHAKFQVAAQKINAYLPALKARLDDKQLIISTEKSTVTLLTPATREARLHPDVRVDNVLLPLNTRPKILGVTFDTMFTFADHGRAAAAKTSRRNNILRALAGTSWGQQKETLLTTYKAVGRPIINYAAPVWTPLLSDTGFKRLQIAQNAALRTASGCLAMSSIDHLHQETAMLPVRDHNVLLTDQFYAAAGNPAHPNHHLVYEPDPPREMKHTIHSFSRKRTADAMAATCPLLYVIQKKLHTTAVETSAPFLATNVVLGGRPPPVSNAEKTLPRKTRAKLAQLRSGYCRGLKSYVARIDPTTADACPHCDGTPHDTAHLFNCPAHPTDLKPIDLWNKPAEAAAHVIPLL